MKTRQDILPSGKTYHTRRHGIPVRLSSVSVLAVMDKLEAVDRICDEALMLPAKELDDSFRDGLGEDIFLLAKTRFGWMLNAGGLLGEVQKKVRETRERHRDGKASTTDDAVIDPGFGRTRDTM